MAPAVRSVEIANGDSKCAISTAGCTVTSWIHKGTEMIFLSKAAVLDGSKAIRGGIPIVFPQFGSGDLLPGDTKRQHGFARDLVWQVKERSECNVTMVLRDSETTLKLYPCAFELECTVSIKDDGSVNQQVRVKATKDALKFTFLLHTYFRVAHIDTVSVSGLQGIEYLDKLTGKREKEPRRLVIIDSEVDRQYFGFPDAIKVEPVARIETEGFPDVVVWNPWVDKSKTLSCFVPSEYTEMVCVEVGKIGSCVELSAGATWTASQTIRPL